MVSFKTRLSNCLSNSTIKIRPYTTLKLAKRLEPLPGLSSLVLQVVGAKEFVVDIGTKKECHRGIRLVGGLPLSLEINEYVFRELFLYSSIDHPDYHLDFDLRGKAWRENVQKFNQLTEEARKTMWIYLAIMQIANSRGVSDQTHGHEI
jgi:hypothetical protein